MSKLKKMVNIFFEPGEVFKDLKNQSDWLLPFSIIILVSIISILLLLPSVIIPNQIEQINSNPNFTIEQKDASIAYLQGPFLYITSLVSAIIGPIIFALLMAGLIMLIRLVFGGEKVEFKNVFSATAYIGIVSTLGTIFTTIIMYTQHTLEASLNLSLIFSGTTGVIHKLIKSIDVFGIWQTILLAICLMVFYRYSKLKSFSIIFGLWIIWKVGLAFISIPGIS